MAIQPVTEGTVLWEPSDEIKNKATITNYINWLKARKGLTFTDYNSLWQWSVTEIEDFLQSLWEFFEIYRPSHGCSPRRPVFLVQYYRLGDVEYSSEQSACGGDTDSL